MRTSSINEDKIQSVPFTEAVPSDNEKALGQVITSVISPNGGKIEISQMDDAMKFVSGDRIEIDEKTNKRLVRKIDFYMCPLMCMMYALQSMDKTSTSYAAVMGLRTDLHMVGQMYNWTGSAFYFGYLIFIFPATLFLQKFPVSKCVSTFIVIWGFILCMHAVPKNYPGFMVLRVLLGMFESAVTPAFVIMTSQWYRTEEQFLRTAIWFAFSGFGNVLGGLIAFGLANNSHSFSLPAWKILFIITGLITIFFGILIFVHIPDYPTQAWFLTEEEKVLVVERIRTNNQGFGNRTFKWDQFKEAFTDITTWIFVIICFCGTIPNGGTSTFGAILLNTTFGYTAKESLLMNTPTGAVYLVGCIAFPYMVKYLKHRIPITLITTILSLVAACLLAFPKNGQAQLAGLYLLGVAPCGMIMILSMFASNSAGHTKKLTVNAIYLFTFCAGNIIGPQTFLARDAPFYLGAKIGIVVCYAVQITVMVGLYYIYWNENRKRDAAREALGDSYKKMENIEFADLTDKQNPDFRYVY